MSTTVPPITPDTSTHNQVANSGGKVEEARQPEPAKHAMQWHGVQENKTWRESSKEERTKKILDDCNNFMYVKRFIIYR